jgi:Co/Zn/Cd efflux system component
MLGVSVVSILVQGVCFGMLQPFDGQEDDKLNLRSALLHLASDLILGVAVIIASCFVYFLHWQHADDWASIVCCVMFIYMYDKWWYVRCYCESHNNLAQVLRYDVGCNQIEKRSTQTS